VTSRPMPIKELEAAVPVASTEAELHELTEQVLKLPRDFWRSDLLRLIRGRRGELGLPNPVAVDKTEHEFVVSVPPRGERRLADGEVRRRRRRAREEEARLQASAAGDGYRHRVGSGPRLCASSQRQHRRPAMIGGRIPCHSRERRSRRTSGSRRRATRGCASGSDPGPGHPGPSPKRRRRP